MENRGKEEKVEVEQPNEKKVNIFKGIKMTWKVLEKVIIIVLIFISAIIITQNVTDNESSFLGFRIFRVQTGSMTGVYDVGDVIIVKEKNIEKIVVGDDVTYWGTSGTMKGKLVTHRVIEIEEIDGKKAFHTKGVANNTEDPIVYGEQINGVVLGEVHILTLICSALTNQYVLYFFGIIPLTIFIFLTFVRKDKIYE